MRKDLSIRGIRSATSGTPTLAGMDRGTVVTVRAGIRLTLADLTVRGGAADRGAGIANRGRLVLRDVIVRGNDARSAGGGIANDAHLRLKGSTSVRGNSSGGGAGGILNGGRLVMEEGSTVTRNTAAAAGGGIVDTGTMTGVWCGENVRHNDPDDCSGG